ncbi:MAG TPA: hypothetical protein VM370_08330 [Candidatus Thermoplasmatota archaeon]|nr:hypothetical protein [Candidatus Thermoplasmatota archaeon]
MEAKKLHDLRSDLPTLGRLAPRAQRKYFWIDDPDLAPAPRKEVPLTAWS